MRRLDPPVDAISNFNQLLDPSKLFLLYGVLGHCLRVGYLCSGRD